MSLFKPRNLPLVLLWTAVLASVALPVFVPAARAAYGGFAQGAILLWLAVLAVPILVVHLSTPRSRRITTCLLFSLALHMFLVTLFGYVDFIERPVDVQSQEPERREIAFGLPSLIENALSQTVRDRPLELNTADARSFENRANRLQPADVKATRPDQELPPTPETESRESLVPEPPAARPELRVDDQIQPGTERTVDASTPEIATIRQIEQAADEASVKPEPRVLETPKADTGVEAKEATRQRPQPVAMAEPVRNPLRDTPDLEPTADPSLQVEAKLDPAEMRADADRLSMPAELSKSESNPEEPRNPDLARQIKPVKQVASSPAPVPAGMERSVNLAVNEPRASSLAEAAVRAEVEPQPRTPGSELVPADANRRPDQPLRLETKAVVLSTENPESRPVAGPSGTIRLPERSRTFSEVLEVDHTRPVAITRPVAVPEGGDLKSLATDRIHSLMSGATAPVDLNVRPEAYRQSKVQPLRGVAASVEMENPVSSIQGIETATLPAATDRTFQRQVGRGEPRSPDQGVRVPPSNGISSAPAITGLRERGETLVSPAIPAMSGETLPVVDRSQASIEVAFGRTGMAGPVFTNVIVGHTAPADLPDSVDAAQATAGSSPAVHQRMAPGRNHAIATPDMPVHAAGTSRPVPVGGDAVPQMQAGFLATPLDVGIAADSPGTSLAGPDFTVDAAGAGRATGQPVVHLVPGTVPVENLPGDAIPAEGGAAADRGTAVPGSWTVARVQTGALPAPVAWTGSGLRMTGHTPQMTGPTDKLVASPTDTLSAQTAPRGLDPDLVAKGQPVVMKSGVDALPLGAKAAVSATTATTGTTVPDPSTGSSRSVSVDKATSGPGTVALEATPSLSPSAAPEIQALEARWSSPPLAGLAGTSGDSQVKVPDTLPRGERMAAYRSVSAAEMMSTPKLSRQKLIYSLRSPEKRQEHIRELGGSVETEQAVERALAWLAGAQSADGRWSVAEFKGVKATGGAGDRVDGDAAVTGLALLAYLGAGYTHTRGDYMETVRKGLAWLLAGQSPDGDLRRGGNLYAQAMATAALCEAFSLSEDPWVQDPARRAVGFIGASQNPEAGWRYEPRMDNDTSVTGWMVLALKSGELAGFPVDPRHFIWTGQWLEQVRRGPGGGLYAYKEGHGPTPVMTAEGWFCQLFMGEQVRMRGEGESALYLMENLPVWDPDTRGLIHFYYWYYATLALHLSGGEAFETWNRALREALLTGQCKDGPAAGSWDPADQLGERGGRIYSTTMATLCLEVYYRYLPFYRNAPSEDSPGKSK